MEFTPVLMDVANAIGVEFNPKYEKYVKSGRNIGVQGVQTR